VQLYCAVSVHDFIRLMQRGGNYIFTFVTTCYTCYLCQRFLYHINRTCLVACLSDVSMLPNTIFIIQ
jgi:hypothetical protein